MSEVGEDVGQCLRIGETVEPLVKLCAIRFQDAGFDLGRKGVKAATEQPEKNSALPSALPSTISCFFCSWAPGLPAWYELSYPKLKYMSLLREYRRITCPGDYNLTHR